MYPYETLVSALLLIIAIIFIKKDIIVNWAIGVGSLACVLFLFFGQNFAAYLTKFEMANNLLYAILVMGAIFSLIGLFIIVALKNKGIIQSTVTKENTHE